MSTITPETVAPHADKVGRVTIVETPDTHRSVWFYVIAALPDGSVFGVNLGTNSSYLAPDGAGMRLQTARIGEYNGNTNDPLSRLGADVLDELTRFLGQTSPTLAAAVASSGDTPATVTGESVEEAYARGQREAREQASREFEAWKAQATATAHEYADENDLCSEFDRCMSEIGLPTRARTYDVTYRVTVDRATIAEYGDVEDWDAEDLFNRVSEGAGRPEYVSSV